MKKLLAIILCFCTLFLIGCVKPSEEASDSISEQQPTSETSDFSEASSEISEEPELVDHSFHATYDYTGEIAYGCGWDKKELRFLYNHKFRFFDLPEDLDHVVAGDVFVVQYWRDKDFPEVEIPENLHFHEVEVVSVEVKPAEIVKIRYTRSQTGSAIIALIGDDGIETEIAVRNLTHHSYYISEFENGEAKAYARLSQIEDSMVLYATYRSDGYGYNAETQEYTFTCFYAVNPR